MKLPKPIQRGSSWRITVTFKKRYSVTRDSAKECEIWAMDKLSELRSGKKQSNRVKSLNIFLEIYAQNIIKNMVGICDLHEPSISRLKTLIVLRQTWQTSLFMILNLLILQSGGTTEKKLRWQRLEMNTQFIQPCSHMP